MTKALADLTEARDLLGTSEALKEFHETGEAIALRALEAARAQLWRCRDEGTWVVAIIDEIDVVLSSHPMK